MIVNWLNMIVNWLITQGVIPGGAGGAVAPQFLANNTFFRVITHH